MKQCPLCQLTYPNESAFCFVEGSTLVLLKDQRIGSTLAGRYVIERELGVGGMATVYAAQHKLVERPCAIKILNPTFAQDPVLRERFVREAKHAQRVAHPNVIEMFDQGVTEDGSPFLVMELLEGRTLADVVGEGPMPLARTLPIGIEMMRALARAHDFEVIHRDLKPENVFLMPGDRVKLLDFGIARCAQDARLTSMGEIFGTPQYMAPERGSSIDAGPAADLYAFGIMLFEMLTGRLPFEAENPALWLLKHLKETPPHLRAIVPDVPEALDRLVFDLMAKDPAERPVDAHRVQALLTIIARALSIRVPDEPKHESSPVSLSPRSLGDPWQRRVELFERMLGRAFPSGAPQELGRALGAIHAHLHEVATLRASALDEQQRLEAVENEARDGRVSLGRAMDALTADVSKTREEARALRAQVVPLGDVSRAFAPQAIAAHRDLIVWEGRSGFHEPHRELAAAYRRMADLVDAWVEARRREIEAEGRAVQKERLIADVDFQIRSLRESLSNLDRSLDERRRKILEKIAEMGRRTQQLEGELFQLATYFCAPLRQRPELGPLFFELERAAPVSQGADTRRASPA
jgi:eukaryotic-like serine/threonine-protein kinase